MDVLTTLFPPVLIFLIVFSAPLFHMILAAGQAVGRLSGDVRVRALPRRRARLRGIAFRGGVPCVAGPRGPARRGLKSRPAS